MNWLDWVILITVGLRGWSGYRRGFFRQVFELVGLVAGLAVALKYYYDLQWWLAVYVQLPGPLLAILAFLLIFLAVQLAARLLGSLCNFLFAPPGLAWLNSYSGALIGALAGVVTIAFLLALLQVFALPPVEVALGTSRVVPYFEQVVSPIMAVVEDYLPWGQWSEPGIPAHTDGRSL